MTGFEPLCDACGLPLDGDHVTRTELCGLTDGPGFYCCTRPECPGNEPGLGRVERFWRYVKHCPPARLRDLFPLGRATVHGDPIAMPPTQAGFADLLPGDCIRTHAYGAAGIPGVVVAVTGWSCTVCHPHLGQFATIMDRASIRKVSPDDGRLARLRRLGDAMAELEDVLRTRANRLAERQAAQRRAAWKDDGQCDD